MPEALIYEAVHSPLTIGKAYGSLYEVSPLAVCVQLLQNLSERQPEGFSRLQALHLACMHPFRDQGGNFSRMALATAGLDHRIVGYNYYGTAGIGWSALASSLQSLQMPPAGKLHIVGGVDSFSRLGQQLDNDPWPFDLDQLRAGRACPLPIQADLLAARLGLSSSELDIYTRSSLKKAWTPGGRSIQSHRLIPICDTNGLTIASEHTSPKDPKSEDEIESAPYLTEGSRHAGLKALARKHFPELEQIPPVHTDYHLGLPADGAALLLIGKADTPFAAHKPLARIRAFVESGGHASDPQAVATEATEQLLLETGLSAREIDSWSFFEGFAADAIRFQQKFDIPAARLNEAGGELCLGYPGGASAAFLICRLLAIMEKKGRKRGIAALGSTSGEGGACLLEWID
jgi:acetyl-CoA acetyltransferase